MVTIKLFRWVSVLSFGGPAPLRLAGGSYVTSSVCVTKVLILSTIRFFDFCTSLCGLDEFECAQTLDLMAYCE